MRGLHEIRRANEERMIAAAENHKPKLNANVTVVPGQLIEESVVLIQGVDVVVVPFEHIDEVYRGMTEVRDEIKARIAQGKASKPV